MKTLSRMTREEKLQAIAGYSPYRNERETLLRYLLAVRRNDEGQLAYFESFGTNVGQIILNVRTYERGLIFGYMGKRFNEYGWINSMLPIVEEIRLDTSNVIHIGQSIDGTYAVAVDWCTGTAGGGSHPSVWDEPVKDYNEAIRQGIRLLEQRYTVAERYSLTDKGNYNPKIIRRLRGRLMEIKSRYTQPRQLSLF